jgi:hypothetical protein
MTRDLANAIAGGGAVLASALGDDLSKLIVIPAAYGVGSSVMGLAARALGKDPDTRKRWKEWGEDLGAAAGFALWLGIVTRG